MTVPDRKALRRHTQGRGSLLPTAVLSLHRSQTVHDHADRTEKTRGELDRDRMRRGVAEMGRCGVLATQVDCSRCIRRGWMV